MTPFVYLVADTLPITSLTLRRLNDAEESWSKLFNRKPLKQNPSKERLQWHTNFITRGLPKLPGLVLFSLALCGGRAEVGLTIIVLITVGIALIASSLIDVGTLLLVAAAIITYYAKTLTEKIKTAQNN